MATAIAADTEIARKISDFITENFLFGDSSKLPSGTESLIENGIIDSTGILEMIEFLESGFGIEVKEEETIPQNLDNLAALTRYVSGKLAAKAYFGQTGPGCTATGRIRARNILSCARAVYFFSSRLRRSRPSESR